MFKLYNEDCIEGLKSVKTASIDAIITDPPFGMVDGDWDVRLNLDEMWREFLRVAKYNAAIVLFSQMPFGAELIMSQRKLFRYEWIWRKNVASGFLNAKRCPLKIHENILVFYRKLPTYNPQFTAGKPYTMNHYARNASTNYRGAKDCVTISDGRRYPVDVQDFKTVNSGEGNTVHPTQKPVDLLEYLILTYTAEGETVLDATMGSGSTGVACVNTGRNFIGFETEPRFFEIAQTRINKALALKEQALF